MATALISHDDCLDHHTPSGHAEQVARYLVIKNTLDGEAFETLQRHDAQIGTKDQVLLAHTAKHFENITNSVPVDGQIALDADTHMSSGSLTAALRAVGGICQAVDLVVAGTAKNAFCAMRPPGHHAETETPMGFCLFGTAAIGAKYALYQKGLNRVAIVDFDVHHGNGTQDLIWNDENILFTSTHQMPLYPGTGYDHETGTNGNVINIPLKSGATGEVLMDALDEVIIPALIRQKPDMLIISAGFDAHRADPLAGLNFETEDFAIATRKLCAFATEHCDGRIVSTLEGGYDLPALAQSVSAHVSALMEYSS